MERVIEIQKIFMEKWIDYSSNLHFISGQITQDGTLLLIESTVNELDFFQRPLKKENWTIRILKENSIETIELRSVPLIPTEVDLFSDGTLLIVQGRCLKDGASIERNARRYNPNGQLIEAFTLGDGISAVQIDESDTIWVSYFDEGIFGSFGWDKPLGSDGLIAYTMNGKKIWGASEYGIIDCYGMNIVSSKEVYFYYYDDFYIVELSNMNETNRYRVQANESIHQFILDESGLIAQVDRDDLIRFGKRNHTLAPKGKLQLTDEKGKRIIGPVFMRGNFLYAYGKDGIYKRKNAK